MTQAAQYLDAIDEYILTAREMLSTGREAELSGMDAIAAQLSQAVGGLTDDERKGCASRIEDIMQQLLALEEQMRGQKAAYGEEISAIEKNRKAFAAYARHGVPPKAGE